MNVNPLTPSCARVLKMGDAAVIGVSPFNSYFSEARIAALAAWAMEQFNMVYYYVPDGPSTYTLLAQGYSEQKAMRKARRQSAWLLNKICRADQLAGGTDVECRLLNSAALNHHVTYQKLLAEVKSRHAQDRRLRAACQNCSSWVLRNYVTELDHRAIDLAVKYLLAEIPLFTHACKIVGHASAVFVYHQCPAFVRGLFLGEYRLSVASNQGYAVVGDQVVGQARERGLDVIQSLATPGFPCPAKQSTGAT